MILDTTLTTSRWKIYFKLRLAMGHMLMWNSKKVQSVMGFPMDWNIQGGVKTLYIVCNCQTKCD